MANQKNDKTQTGQTSGAASPRTAPDVSTPPAAGAALGTPSAQTGITGTKLKDTAADLYGQAKETASETLGAVADKASSAVEERKGQFSTGLTNVADSFRQAGSQLRTKGETDRVAGLTAEYSGIAADKLEKFARYFDEHDARAMMRDVENFARRNPAIFLGGAFALGMIAARFLKSSPPSDTRGFGRETIDPTPGIALPPAEKRPSSDRPSVGTPPRNV